MTTFFIPQFEKVKCVATLALQATINQIAFWYNWCTPVPDWCYMKMELGSTQAKIPTAILIAMKLDGIANHISQLAFAVLLRNRWAPCAPLKLCERVTRHKLTVLGREVLSGRKARPKAVLTEPGLGSLMRSMRACRIVSNRLQNNKRAYVTIKWALVKRHRRPSDGRVTLWGPCVPAGLGMDLWRTCGVVYGLYIPPLYIYTVVVYRGWSWEDVEIAITPSAEAYSMRRRCNPLG